MIQCLRKNILYADKRSRDILFLAIEQVLDANRGDGLMLSRLTREAAAFARPIGELAGIDVNWDMASKAVINAMLQSGVLMGADGTTVPVGVSALAAKVASLKAGYVDAVEAFLVEFLIRKLGDVTTRDHKALAHALFRQFDPNVLLGDLEDRVVLLIATLADSVILSADGVYSAHPPPVALRTFANG